MVRELKIERLGRIPYVEALELQEKQVEAVRGGVAGDTLFLLEHPPVITLGRRADPAHVLVATPELLAQGVELHTVTRGGDVTYHGPGQLVGYLVCDLAARGATDVTRSCAHSRGVSSTRSPPSACERPRARAIRGFSWWSPTLRSPARLRRLASVFGDGSPIMVSP